MDRARLSTVRTEEHGMTWTTIRSNALLSLTSLDRAGEIRYDSRQHALVVLPGEVVNTTTGMT